MPATLLRVVAFLPNSSTTHRNQKPSTRNQTHTSTLSTHTHNQSRRSIGCCFQTDTRETKQKQTSKRQHQKHNRSRLTWIHCFFSHRCLQHSFTQTRLFFPFKSQPHFSLSSISLFHLSSPLVPSLHLSSPLFNLSISLHLSSISLPSLSLFTSLDLSSLLFLHLFNPPPTPCPPEAWGTQTKNEGKDAREKKQEQLAEARATATQEANEDNSDSPTNMGRAPTSSAARSRGAQNSPCACA